MKRLSPMAQRLIGALAQDECRESGLTQLMPEHAILALLKSETGIGYYVFSELKLNPYNLKKSLENYFDYSNPRLNFDDLPYGRRFLKLQDIANIESDAMHNDYVGTEHLLLAAIREEGSITSLFFQKNGIFIGDIRKKVLDLQSKKLSSIHNNLSASQSIFLDLVQSAQPETNAFFKETKHEKRKENSILQNFSRDLTEMAREMKLDPVIGRENEINRI